MTEINPPPMQTRQAKFTSMNVRMMMASRAVYNAATDMYILADEIRPFDATLANEIRNQANNVSRQMEHDDLDYFVACQLGTNDQVPEIAGLDIFDSTELDEIDRWIDDQTDSNNPNPHIDRLPDEIGREPWQSETLENDAYVDHLVQEQIDREDAEAQAAVHADQELQNAVNEFGLRIIASDDRANLIAELKANNPEVWAAFSEKYMVYDPEYAADHPEQTELGKAIDEGRRRLRKPLEANQIRQEQKIADAGLREYFAALDEMDGGYGPGR